MSYNRVNWINEKEGTTTPLNAENLNTMDEGISNLDERVTVLEESQGGDIVERVEALETDNATNKTNINNINGRVGTLETDNTTIKQNIIDINTDINNLDGRVTDLENETRLTDAFSTVVANGTNITASGSDSFKLKAGSNVNITANATTKEIIISSTGGGGGGGGVPESIIADAWNSTTDYTKGMYCMDSGLMWKCLADNTNVKPTEGTYWTSKTVGEGLSNLTANDGLDFRFATDGAGNYGYLGADDSFIPFKAGGSSNTVYIYNGYYTYKSVGGYDFAMMKDGYLSFVHKYTGGATSKYFEDDNIEVVGAGHNFTITPKVDLIQHMEGGSKVDRPKNVSFSYSSANTNMPRWICTLK